MVIRRRVLWPESNQSFLGAVLRCFPRGHIEDCTACFMERKKGDLALKAPSIDLEALFSHQ